MQYNFYVKSISNNVYLIPIHPIQFIEKKNSIEK